MITIDSFRIPLQIRILVAVALSSLISGCAQTRIMTLESAPMDLYEPTVPIEVYGFSMVTDRHGHIIAGAGEGIGKGMAFGAAAPVGELGLIGILLAPVGAVAGGIAGGFMAHPAKETDTATDAIEEVYSDQLLLGSITEKIGDRMLRMEMPIQSPHDKSANQLQSENKSDEFDSMINICKSESKNCLLLFISYGFHTLNGQYSPDLRFVIHVRAVSTNAARSNTFDEFRWAYKSSEFNIFEATKNKCEILRNKLTVAQEQLSDRIIDDLFLVRSSAEIEGNYHQLCKRKKLISPSNPIDVAYRVPTQEQLNKITEQNLCKQQ